MGGVGRLLYAITTNRMSEKVTAEDKLKTLYILLGCVTLVWVISFLIIYFCIPESNDRGTFGDSFGAINSLFSGLALSGIIYTILLQRKELSLQRQELRETRLELERSANAQELSQRELKRQSENLKMTAKLNALNTLVIFYNDQEAKNVGRNPGKVNEAQRQREIYLNQIKEILNNKNG